MKILLKNELFCIRYIDVSLCIWRKTDNLRKKEKNGDIFMSVKNNEIDCESCRRLT